MKDTLDTVAHSASEWSDDVLATLNDYEDREGEDADGLVIETLEDLAGVIEQIETLATRAYDMIEELAENGTRL